MDQVSKVTIRMPADLLDAVDRERQARGETRSAFFLRAVGDHLRRERRRQADEQYIRGYQQFPESEDEELMAWVQWAQAQLTEILEDESWDEEAHGCGSASVRGG